MTSLRPLQKPALEVHLLISNLVQVYQLFQYATLHEPQAIAIAAVKIHCSHQCFKRIACYVTVVHMGAALILHQFVKPNLHCQAAERIALHNLAARSGEESLLLSREVAVHNLTHHGIQYSIAQEFQPLVVLRFLPFHILCKGLVHESLAIILYMPRIEPQHGIKRAIKFPFLSEGEPYRID